MGAEVRTFLRVWLALLALLAATVAAHFLPLPVPGPVANMSIALAKAGLVVWFFMHLRETAGLARVVALAGLVFLAILFLIGLSDWLAR